MAEDWELVERLRRGDREALRRIYLKFKDDLVTMACCMLVDRSDAEDCLHDLFVTLAANATRLRPGGNLKGYLVTAMANRCRDRLRKRKRVQQTAGVGDRAVGDELAATPDPIAKIIEREETSQLYHAITKLPPEQRFVITLRLHGELTFEQIAEQMGVSNNTVRSRYRYGLDKLRSFLDVGVEP